MIRKERLVELLQGLVQAPSENPPGNEEAVSKVIEEAFSSAGIDTKRICFEKNRPNILATFKGKSSEGSVIFIAHSDTVPAGDGWSVPPFSGTIKDGKLYGRGATDDKCHIAILAELAKSMKEDGAVPKQDIIFLAMADEESGGGAGLIPLVKNNNIPAKSAIILDDTDFNICTAQKGLVHAKATIFGKKAHGAYPEKGRSAIEDAAKIICRLKEEPIACPKHPALGLPTINIGTIKGGDRVNIVADKCAFDIDYRFCPPITSEKITEHINTIISKYTKKYDLHVEGRLEPAHTDDKNPLVSEMRRAIMAVGRKAEVRGIAGSTLLAVLVEKGMPAISLGFGAKNVTHNTDEYVFLDDIFDGARVIEQFIKEYIGIEKN